MRTEDIDTNQAASALQQACGYEYVRYIGNDDQGRMLFDCNPYGSNGAETWAVKRREMSDREGEQ